MSVGEEVGDVGVRVGDIVGEVGVEVGALVGPENKPKIACIAEWTR